MAGVELPQKGCTINNLILAAAAFAADKHRGQRRKGPDADPYINHPLGVANVLANEAAVSDPVTLAAALLHDTVEDTDTSITELRDLFGREVAGVVLEVTDDKSLDTARRKALQIAHAATLSERAKLVKFADKICNLRDLSRSPPADWSLERRMAYFDWARDVVSQMRGVSPRLEALFETEFARRPAS